MLPLLAPRHSQSRLPLTWQGLLRGVLLALLLLVAQQGALFHELSHYATQEAAHDATHRHDQQPQSSDPCDTCLAYAHLGTTHTFALLVPTLLLGLAYGLSPGLESQPFKAALHSLRNRGPPTAR